MPVGETEVKYWWIPSQKALGSFTLTKDLNTCNRRLENNRPMTNQIKYFIQTLVISAKQEH